MSDVVNVKVNGVSCIIPTSNADLQETVIQSGLHVNGFKNPGGRNYGMGNFLLLKSDIPAIESATDISVTITDGHETVTIDKLLLADTVRFAPTDNSGDVLLATLVDYRFLSQKMPQRLDVDPFPPHVKYKDEDFLADEIFVETNQEGILAYWDNSNTTIDSGEVDISEADFPSILFRDVLTPNTGSSWNQLNDILDLMSHQVYLREGGYAIVKNSFDTSENSLIVDSTDNKERLMSKRYSDAGQLTFLPKKVNVRYRKLDCDFLNQCLEVEKTYGGSEFTIASLIKDLNCYNMFDEEHEDADAYEMELNTLATELSNLYFGSFVNDQLYNAVYFGVVAFIPGPDCHILEYYHDATDNIYKTLIKSIELKDISFPEIITDLELLYHDYSCGRSRLFKAPFGGIPARQGLNPGVAECTLLKRKIDVNEIVLTETMFDVYNWASQVVCAEGERFGISDLDSFGTWWVEAEECYL